MTEEELVEKVAWVMHYAYEATAIKSGWQTNEASRVPWDIVPETNKQCTRAAARAAIAAMREAGAVFPPAGKIPMWVDDPRKTATVSTLTQEQAAAAVFSVLNHPTRI